MLVKFLWTVFMMTGPATLKISAGRPSIQDALLMLVCLIAFLASSRVGGRSRLSVIVFFSGIKSRAAGSAVEGLLSRLEKCSIHCAMMLSLSLSKTMLSEESKGVVFGYEGPSTTLKELKTSLKLLQEANCWTYLPCCSTNCPAFFKIPSGLCSSDF